MSFLKVEDLQVYRLAFDLSNEVWDIVMGWAGFEKDWKADDEGGDSISANIAEGFGRNGRHDKSRFYIYARASALELEDWLKKAEKRGFTPEVNRRLMNQIHEMPRMINYQIKYTREKLM